MTKTTKEKLEILNEIKKIKWQKGEYKKNPKKIGIFYLIDKFEEKQKKECFKAFFKGILESF